MESSAQQKHIIGMLVQNRPGVLARVVGLFSGRGFNIENITAAETNEPGITRITVVTSGDEHILVQIVKQVNKLIDIIKVFDFREMEYVDREMVLIKVRAEQQTRAEVLRISDIFRGKVVDVSPHYYTIEVTGNESKISAILELLGQIGIVEVARTGKAALPRAKKH